MNDSFLEDLQIIPTDAACQPDRHVTTRNAVSTPLPRLFENDAERFVHKQTNVIPMLEICDMSNAKQPNEKTTPLRSPKKAVDVKKQVSKTRISDKQERIIENKLAPVENKMRIEKKEQISKENVKVKLRETRTKTLDSKTIEKDRTRRSGSYKENSHSSGISSKENSHPMNTSKENGSTIDMHNEKRRASHESTTRKSDPMHDDPVILLSAIKDLISTYAKQESSKILRAMHDLHVNSQASLIKNLLFQKDDLIRELHPCKHSAKMKALEEENQKLREDLKLLQLRNNELQKKLIDFEVTKQDIVALNSKRKDFSK